MFLTAYASISLRLRQLNTEGQTRKTESLIEKLQNSNQNSS